VLQPILKPNGRILEKPRNNGITIVLDVSLGLHGIQDLVDVAGQHCDCAKIAWGSGLITGNLRKKIEAYRDNQIYPLLGGTLFEYAYLHGTTEELLSVVREHKLHLELSDGVVSMSRRDKLQWIERFAKVTEVFSEVGGKVVSQDLDWVSAIREELAAGAKKVVIEGREIGPVGQNVRQDLIDLIVQQVDVSNVVFEALERKQQVHLIKHIGPNVNLGNIRPEDVLTLESFRQGLKEHTLLHFAPPADDPLSRP